MEKNNTNPQPYFSDFEALVQRKHNTDDKKRLVKLLPKIKDSFEEYALVDEVPELLSRQKATKTQKQALHSCFSGAKFQEELYTKFLGVTVPPGETRKKILCSYCRTRISGAWDHFLPSSLYPYYSAYPPNLVRACTICNTAKGDRWVEYDRATLHPYVDAVDKVQFLQCQITLSPHVSVNFLVDVPVGVNSHGEYTAEIAKRHFVNYELAELYQGESVRIIGDLVILSRAIKNTSGNPTVLVNEYMLQKNNSLISAGAGINNWERVLYEALLNVNNLANYL
jgi:5-methylcytosine-specific restriction endonuclease McrA